MSYGAIYEYMEHHSPSC